MGIYIFFKTFGAVVQTLNWWDGKIRKFLRLKVLKYSKLCEVFEYWKKNLLIFMDDFFHGFSGKILCSYSWSGKLEVLGSRIYVCVYVQTIYIMNFIIDKFKCSLYYISYEMFFFLLDLFWICLSQNGSSNIK